MLHKMDSHSLNIDLVLRANMHRLRNLNVADEGREMAIDAASTDSTNSLVLTEEVNIPRTPVIAPQQPPYSSELEDWAMEWNLEDARQTQVSSSCLEAHTDNAGPETIRDKYELPEPKPAAAPARLSLQQNTNAPHTPTSLSVALNLSASASSQQDINCVVSSAHGAQHKSDRARGGRRSRPFTRTAERRFVGRESLVHSRGEHAVRSARQERVMEQWRRLQREQVLRADSEGLEERIQRL